MILTDWLTVAGICMLGAISPGPSLAIVIKHTLAGGRPAGVVAAVTHGLGVGLYAFICISGLAVVITTSPGWFAALQWVGAAYLFWLGIKGITSKPSSTLAGGVSAKGKQITGHSTESPGNCDNYLCDNYLLAQDHPQTAFIKDAARDGFMIVFLNPKIAVFFIALFSQLVGPDTAPLVRTVYVMTALVIDAGWYLLVAWLFSVPLWLAKLRQNAFWFERLFGCILIALAGRLVVDLL